MTTTQSLKKKIEIVPFAATCVGLESIIVSKVSQTKTNIIYRFYVESKKKINKRSKGTRLQNRNRLTDIANH